MKLFVFSTEQGAGAAAGAAAGASGPIDLGPRSGGIRRGTKGGQGEVPNCAHLTDVKRP